MRRLNSCCLLRKLFILTSKFQLTSQLCQLNLTARCQGRKATFYLPKIHHYKTLIFPYIRTNVSLYSKRVFFCTYLSRLPKNDTSVPRSPTILLVLRPQLSPTAHQGVDTGTGCTLAAVYFSRVFLHKKFSHFAQNFRVSFAESPEQFSDLSDTGEITQFYFFTIKKAE